MLIFCREQENSEQQQPHHSSLARCTVKRLPLRDSGTWPDTQNVDFFTSSAAIIASSTAGEGGAAAAATAGAAGAVGGAAAGAAEQHEADSKLELRGRESPSCPSSLVRGRINLGHTRRFVPSSRAIQRDQMK